VSSAQFCSSTSIPDLTFNTETRKFELIRSVEFLVYYSTFSPYMDSLYFVCVCIYLSKIYEHIRHKFFIHEGGLFNLKSNRNDSYMEQIILKSKLIQISDVNLIFSQIYACVCLCVVPSLSVRSLVNLFSHYLQ